MSPSVRLRDVVLADADLLDAWATDTEARSEYNDFGLPAQRTPRDVLRAGPMRNEHNGMLIVELADGTPIGTVGWHKVGYGPNRESDAWNVGIELRPEARGHGYGSAAQRLLADYLFETTPLHRVEACTDVDNVVEQRALEKAGYRREGIQRGAQFRGGSYRDLVTFARLREDP